MSPIQMKLFFYLLEEGENFASRPDLFRSLCQAQSADGSQRGSKQSTAADADFCRNKNTSADGATNESGTSLTYTQFCPLIHQAHFMVVQKYLVSLSFCGCPAKERSK